MWLGEEREREQVQGLVEEEVVVVVFCEEEDEVVGIGIGRRKMWWVMGGRV